MRTNNYSIARMLFLLILAAVMPTMAMAEDTYIVAGNNGSVFSEAWNPTLSANQMTKDADGLYKKTYSNAPAANYELKVVKNGGTDNETWYGDSNGNNVVFSLTKESNFTVTFNPTTNEVKVEGNAVTFNQNLSYSYVVLAGNGEEVGNGKWLNGESWNVQSAKNRMSQVQADVWQITYENVPQGTGYEFKFVLDGDWGNPNYGGSFRGNGVETRAERSGANIRFNVKGETAKVTIKLDLRYGADEAKFTVIVDEPFTYSSIYATGDWLPGTQWAADELLMTEVEEDVWEVDVTTIPQGNYSYSTKFTVDGSWDLEFGGSFTGSGVESDAKVNTPDNNIVFHQEDIEGVSLVKLRLDLRNFDYLTSQGAKFTITMYKDQTTILRDDDVTEPSKAYGNVIYDRSFVAGYNTLVLPFDADLDEVASSDFVEAAYAYGGSTYNETNKTVSVDFSQNVTTLSANTPYILKFKKAQNEVLSFTNKQVSPSTPVISDDYYSFVGTYVALPEDNKTIVSGDYVCTAAGLKAASGGNKLNAFRAYLRSEAISVAPSAKMEVKVGADTIVVGEGDTTGISLDELLNNSTSDIYNLNGQKVSQPQKGVYIINGKKVVRK